MTLLLCAFGAYLFVLFVRLIIPAGVPVASLFKLGLALVGSFGIAWLLIPHHSHEMIAYGVAGAGLASLVHRLGRLAIVTGDLVILRVHRERSRR